MSGAATALKVLDVVLDVAFDQAKAAGTRASSQFAQKLSSLGYISGATASLVEENPLIGLVGFGLGVAAVVALATPIGGLEAGLTGAAAKTLAEAATALGNSAITAFFAGSEYQILGSALAAEVSSATSLMTSLMSATINFFVSEGVSSFVSYLGSDTVLGELAQTLSGKGSSIYNGTVITYDPSLPTNMDTWNSPGGSTNYSVYTPQLSTTPISIGIQNNAQFGIVQGVISDGSSTTLIVNYGGPTGNSSISIGGGTIDPATTAPPYVTEAADGSVIVGLPSADGNAVIVDYTAADTASIMIGADGGTTGQQILSFSGSDLDGDTIDVTDTTSSTFVVTTDIGPADTFEVDSDTGADTTQSFDFSGSGGLLKIDTPGSFTGTIYNFVPGDTIDLVGITAASASVNADGTLVVQEDDGSTLSFQLDPSENYSAIEIIVDDSNPSIISATSPAPPSTDPQTVTVDAPVTTYGPNNSPTITTYTASVGLSATNIEFASERTSDESLQAIPLTLTYTGGDPDPAEARLVTVSLADDQGFYLIASPLTYSVAASATLGPDNPTQSLYVYTNNVEAGDYTGDALPVIADYDNSTATIDLTVGLKIYAPATAGFSVDGSGDIYNFGVMHVGQTATVDVAVTNTTTAALTDTLSTSIGTVGEFTADNAVSGFASGQSGTVAVTFDAEVAGEAAIGGGSLFNPVSHDSDLPDVAASGGVLMDAEVWNYAQPVLAAGTIQITDGVETVALETGPATGVFTQTGEDSYNLDFGTISNDESSIAYMGNIVVENTAPSTGLSDILGGTATVLGTGIISSSLEFPVAVIAGQFGEFDDFSLDLTSLGTHTLTVTFDPTSIDNFGTTALAPITLTVTDDVVACFAAGTRILSDRGEIAVERLTIGDYVRTIDGEALAVTWIGYRRIDCSRHPRPRDVWPVRIAPGTFGHGMPHRDLFLSPDHAVFVDGALIPIKHLINGSSVVQVPVDEVTYYHIELPEHDVLLAEGLPAESYLDTGDRGNFSNSGEVTLLFPDFASQALDPALLRDAKAYAPLVVWGAKLEAARRIVQANTVPSVSAAAAA